jgi:hypothetical protein
MLICAGLRQLLLRIAACTVTCCYTVKSGNRRNSLLQALFGATACYATSPGCVLNQLALHAHKKLKYETTPPW